MLYDLMLVALLAVIASLPGLIVMIVLKDEGKHLADLISRVGISFVWAGFLNKDMFSGQSPGKAQFKFRVIALSGEPASPIRCLIRNLTVFIWPVELMVIYFQPMRRIGDFVAGTKLVSSVEMVTRPARSLVYYVCIIIATWVPLFLTVWYTSVLFDL